MLEAFPDLDPEEILGRAPSSVCHGPPRCTRQVVGCLYCRVITDDDLVFTPDGPRPSDEVIAQMDREH